MFKNILLPIVVLAINFTFAQAQTKSDSMASQENLEVNSRLISATASSTVLLNEHPAGKAVELFFQNFHKQDTVALKNQFVENASMQSLAIRGSDRKLSTTTIDDFLKSIASIPQKVSFEERLTSLKTTADNDIASVHTDYEFYVNGKLSHRGRNVFTMIYIDDSWKVAQVTDTREY